MTEQPESQAARIDAIVATHEGMPGNLLPILHAVQHEFGYLPEASVARIAAGLNLSRAEVHGVVSFYSHFRRQPPGRHVLRICRAEACQAVQGCRTEQAAKDALGIGWGETSADGRFTLEAVFCLGNCAAGPSIMIDETLHGRVTPERLAQLLAVRRQE